MKQTLFLGIDGGGTKCKVRLENQNRQLLGEAVSGPANIATSVTAAQTAILKATMTALTKAQLPASAIADIHAFAGLAGANVAQAQQAMRTWQCPFAQFDFTSDAHIACLGAHQHQDGGIIILGTGFCAGLVKQGQFREFGGHGLWLSDGASGAWIGLSLIKCALEVLDTLAAPSLLIDTLLEQLHCSSAEELVALTLQAPPHYFGQFAPLVFNHAQDPHAQRILRSAAAFIERYLRHLQQLGAQEVALVGGIAEPICPWLSDDIATLLVPPKRPPEDAALAIAREQFLA